MRIWLDLWDDQAKHARYNATPQVSNDTTILRSYKLAKYTRHDGQWVASGEVYLIDMRLDGCTTCNCPGHAHHRHCKHVDALVAAGMLERELVLRLRGLILENEDRARELAERAGAYALATAEAQAQTPAPKPRRSRSKKAQAEAPAEAPA